MKIKDTYEFRIPLWAVCAIEYNDYTGLDDTEENSLRSFLTELPAGGCFSYGEEEYFSYNNNINGLGGNVVDAIYTIFDN